MTRTNNLGQIVEWFFIGHDSFDVTIYTKDDEIPLGKMSSDELSDLIYEHDKSNLPDDHLIDYLTSHQKENL